jgi:hypothetical protein
MVRVIVKSSDCPAAMNDQYWPIGIIMIIIIIIQFSSFIYVFDNSQIRPNTAKH